jgi:choline dehydrogenase-like flavoprotein
MTIDESYDVVVVGSGPAGAAYARVIAEEWPAARLLMVEAGPIVSDPAGSHVANIRDDARRLAAQIASQGPHDHAAYQGMTEAEIRTRRAGGHDTSMLRRPGMFRVGTGPVDGDEFPAAHASHCVGGMGAHWFCACPRPAEAERVPFIPRGELDGALDRAAALLRVSRTQYAASPVATELRSRLARLFDAGRPQDRRVQPMPWAVNTVDGAIHRSAPDTILGELAEGRHPGFSLLPDTVCLRVTMDGGRATGVEVRSRHGGERRRIAARYVVVAADSLHTPQLLFASGIRPAALGRHLNEHPQLTVLAEFEGVPPGEDAGLAFAGGVLGDRTVTARMGTGVTWVPFLGDDFPYHVQISQVEPSSLLPEDQVVARQHAVLTVSFFLCSDLQWSNAVTFSETETDWLGRPRMALRFRMSDDDRARVERARADLHRICGAVGRILPGHTPRLAPFGTSLHYQGTIRMGEYDDGRSVCNRFSRVWGTENLHVAGNGVIPTRTAGNPTLTAVALATLGASRIAGEGKAA